MASVEMQQDWQLTRSVLASNKYMLENQLQCDITFKFSGCKVEETSISAHKYMLISRSPVFYAMFTGPLKDESSQIYIEDVEKDVFMEMLRYIYFEQAELKGENVLALLYCGKKYMISGLKDKCGEFLKNQLDPNNVCLLLQNAALMDEPSLEEKCLILIDESSSEALNSDGFTHINKETAEKIVRRDTLGVEEVEVYKACIRWAIAECKREKLQATDENRRKVLGSILYWIRFPVMDADTFIKYVMKDKVLKSDECMDIVLHAKGCSPHDSIPFPMGDRTGCWKEIFYNTQISNQQSYKAGGSIFGNQPYVIQADHINFPITIQNAGERLLRVQSVILVDSTDILVERVNIGSDETKIIKRYSKMYEKCDLNEAVFDPPINLESGKHTVTITVSTPKPLPQYQCQSGHAGLTFGRPSRNTIQNFTVPLLTFSDPNYSHRYFTLSVHGNAFVVGFICKSKEIH